MWVCLLETVTSDITSMRCINQIRTFALNMPRVWISIWPEMPEKPPLDMQEQQMNTSRTYFGCLSSSPAAHPSKLTNSHWSPIFEASFFNLKQKELQTHKVGCSQGLIKDLQEGNSQFGSAHGVNDHNG